MTPDPAGHSSCLQVEGGMEGQMEGWMDRVMDGQADILFIPWGNKVQSLSMLPTYIVLHNLWVVSVKDGRSEPAQVELHVSLSCFDVPLVANVHRLSPVSRQGDAHQPFTQEQTAAFNTNTPNTNTPNTSIRLQSLVVPSEPGQEAGYLSVCFSTVCHKYAKL